jgi:hypothetical protein
VRPLMLPSIENIEKWVRQGRLPLRTRPNLRPGKLPKSEDDLYAGEGILLAFEAASYPGIQPSICVSLVTDLCTRKMRWGIIIKNINRWLEENDYLDEMDHW